MAVVIYIFLINTVIILDIGTLDNTYILKLLYLK